MKPYTLEDAEHELRAAIDADNTATIAALEPVIDQLAVHIKVSLEEAALWYAEQGLHVFPLSPGSKIPFKGTGGFRDASTDPDQIRSWWSGGNPRANIGIATGHLIDVIDIDGPAGVQSWLQLADDLPPILGKVSTPRPGGNHLYVQAVPGRGNKAGLFPGIDYRGAGGYVVAPPSIIASGDHPGSYTWRTPLNLPEEVAVA